jgi:two-component system, NarL family, nitrate/nitrite response regulator NarL
VSYPVRVFLADDHPLFLGAVADVIGARPELDLVGAASNGSDAVTQMTKVEPDVAVLDMRLRGLSGQEVLAIVTERLPRTRVLFLSGHIESDLVFTALAGGAAGYLSKEVDREAICRAIVDVADGATVLSPEVQRQLAGAIRHRDTHERPVLTPREQAVLVLAADGLSTREMAVRLNVASATVKTHLQSIYHKLDVPDRASAVAAAMRRGMLE